MAPHASLSLLKCRKRHFSAENGIFLPKTAFSIQVMSAVTPAFLRNELIQNHGSEPFGSTF
jgi:hypothetical protein